MMTKTFTLDELMFLSDDEIRQFLHQEIECQTKKGLLISGKITNFELAANTPNHICGFIMQNGNRVGFGSIQKLTIGKI